jgi:hypothetical protein
VNESKASAMVIGLSSSVVVQGFCTIGCGSKGLVFTCDNR